MFSALLYAGLALLVITPVSLALAGKELSFVYPLAWSLFAAATAFGIAYTGRVSGFRRVFFTVSAAAFLFRLKGGLLTGDTLGYCFDAVARNVPYCHISMASFLPERAHEQYIAMKIGYWDIFWGALKLAGVWLLATLAIGPAWCSWVCCFGGINDGFSAIVRRPLIKSGKWAVTLRDMPAALLIFMLLASLAYATPVFCQWFCPLNVPTAFADPAVMSAVMKYALTAAGIIALAIAPLLTGKKIFCAYLCPFAAWQALWGKLSPFRIKTDAANCVNCGLCAAACPMNAMKRSPEGKPEPGAYCNMCGECVSACPRGGLRYTVAGTALPARTGIFGSLFTAEKLHTFAALVLGAAFSSLWAPAAIKKAFELVFK